ncbi:type I DNA topoisomerase [Afifella sp. IM 167]|uniref:type I DNA topoisomerase n=1 Tax=Afifella sp. IM 167 TaxID=2033586 RepID=UPI001CCC0E95|nr:type I DNA topoisomerase [Afifella sp. IM 167]MBZ8132619.1 DNA topoisomerase I [Afifella sp. IM 167]
MDLVIVESPAKAKTINKYLGSDYQVLASYGHVRDLPSKDGSVRPDEDFAMSWEVADKAKKRLADIAEAAKSADRILLATDPDREGEAISWHVLEVLRSKKGLKDKPVARVVFNAITKSAVQEAMANPRLIDEALVEAYLARRALDYLVGFSLSPVLWRKLPGARSAGRVQSVALRLVCDREGEIERFRAQEYWSLAAELATPSHDTFTARLVAEDGKKLTKLSIGDEADANRLKTLLDGASYSVANVESKPHSRNPQPPFTTSTLQQEAQRKLGFDASRTMQVAQRLYEGVDIGGETIGLITYMRTDGVDIAPEALAAVRGLIQSDFGAPYLPEQARRYFAKAKNAQEAHEAIRPTDPARLPADVERRLDRDQARLYELIWKRTMASQMASAEMERTTIEVEARSGAATLGLRATGSVVRFDGFLALYQEGRDEPEDEEGGRLPPVKARDALDKKAVSASQHFTEPPPRYTEASLIKKMEELGIGRPSTYAQTMTVLRDRGYVRLDKRRLMPEDKGRLVTAFLESFFRRYVEYDFTADLEEKLDMISAGELSWQAVLRDFWRDFQANLDDIKELRVSEVLEALNEILGDFVFPSREDGSDPRICPSCGDGKLSLKLGRYGAFIGCSNYPECRYTRQVTEPDPESALGQQAMTAEGVMLGDDPTTGEPVTLRSGRFGPYVQLGSGDKPKRTSLPRGWEPEAMDLDKALQLLSLPREIAPHPETGKPITAGIGRYGPFVSHEGKYANLDNVEEVFTVGANRAVSLLAEKKKGRTGAKEIKGLGEHPDGGAIQVMEGRYGPYVHHGKINATLPKGKDPQNLTLEEALELIEAKAAKGGKTPAKKTTTKKAATAKKPTKAKSTKSASTKAKSGPAKSRTKSEG